MFKLINIFNLLLTSLYAVKNPSWFHLRNLPHLNTQIVGYGKAENYNLALQLAKSEIAQMLQSNIDSILIIDKNSTKNEYNREIRQRTKVISSVKLNDLNVIRRELLNDIWYVAIIYDNLPLFQKIIKSVNPQNIKHSNHPYLTKTKLFKQLKEYFGFYPKATIYSQNGQYYIAIDNQQFLISHQEFIELFINSSYPNIEIQLKEKIKENEPYFITTKFREAGFASLFSVSHSGAVINLFKNIRLFNATFIYPNKEEYNGLRAEIENGAKQSRDMFIAILCKQKEDLELFNQISTTLEQESFRFGDLTDLMARCAFSTKILTIIR